MPAAAVWKVGVLPGGAREMGTWWGGPQSPWAPKLWALVKVPLANGAICFHPRKGGRSQKVSFSVVRQWWWVTSCWWGTKKLGSSSPMRPFGGLSHPSGACRLRQQHVAEMPTCWAVAPTAPKLCSYEWVPYSAPEGSGGRFPSPQLSGVLLWRVSCGSVTAGLSRANLPSAGQTHSEAAPFPTFQWSLLGVVRPSRCCC